MGKDHGSRHGVSAPENVDQQFDGRLAQVTHRLRNTRQRWSRVLSEGNIVEAHDRQIAWNVQSVPSRTVHHANRHLVLRAEDCGGARAFDEELFCCKPTTFKRELAIYGAQSPMSAFARADQRAVKP